MIHSRFKYCLSYSVTTNGYYGVVILCMLNIIISWYRPYTYCLDSRSLNTIPSSIPLIRHASKITQYVSINIRGGAAAAADFMADPDDDDDEPLHNGKGFHNFRYHPSKQQPQQQQRTEIPSGIQSMNSRQGFMDPRGIPPQHSLSSSTVSVEYPNQEQEQQARGTPMTYYTQPSSSSQLQQGYPPNPLTYSSYPTPDIHNPNFHSSQGNTVDPSQINSRNSWEASSTPTLPRPPTDPTLLEPDMFDPEPPLPDNEDDTPLPPPPLPSGTYNNHNSYDTTAAFAKRHDDPPSEDDPVSKNISPPSPTSSSSLDLNQFNKDLIYAGLKRLYRKKILPLELSSKYGHFHSPPLSPSDFDAKPMVLLLGQYSVGKTSFIQYLLGRDFPGIRIGPEPTTDRFTCILQGRQPGGDKVIPGAALCSQGDRPFRGLSPMGNNFLSRFEGIELVDAPILENITLVDTPGILSGSKQGSMGRNYDYDAVMKWFAERADLIIIMFDAHKLDISDELKRVIEMLKPHQDKIRVVLNKADGVSTQQLLRVYGALMWGLGKVMLTPEVCRVFVCSLWDAPLQNKEQATLLYREKLDLFKDIASLPQNAVMRRINELVKRARSVKVHAYIIHYLRKQMPYSPWGRQEKQRRLIDRLDRELIMCARRYELPRGDFPPVEPLRQALLEIKDLSEFPKLDKRMVKDMDRVFSVDIPELLEKARIS